MNNQNLDQHKYLYSYLKGLSLVTKQINESGVFKGPFLGE